MLRLGVIGMSEGNGHPYSWSAIINGYDREAMASCPFPAIPDYLGRQAYPEDFIKGARVTHVWTQDPAISAHVSKAARVDHIARAREDMIGQVDAILMARDDYQNHERFSAPFLKAGLPVYIDKPLANSVEGAERLLDLQTRERQIFTCSALRYAAELKDIKTRLCDIHSISAHTPKSWSLYSIHIIEPVIALLGAGETPERLAVGQDGEKVIIDLLYGEKALRFQSAGEAKGAINFVVTYKDGTVQEVVISDMFYAFRTALEEFLKQVRSGGARISLEETMMCMRLIEMGKDHA